LGALAGTAPAGVAPDAPVAMGNFSQLNQGNSPSDVVARVKVCASTFLVSSYGPCLNWEVGMQGVNGVRADADVSDCLTIERTRKTTHPLCRCSCMSSSPETGLLLQIWLGLVVRTCGRLHTIIILHKNVLCKHSLNTQDGSNIL
jgi:hypothetical protein